MSGDGTSNGDLSADDSPDDGSGAPDPPPGWTVWNDEPRGRRILVYRPEVFNEANDLPAPCLPTILVSNRSRAPRPGASRVRTDTWRAVLTLEPEVEAVTEAYDTRAAAVEGANDIASRFAAGAVDYRAAYQVPREDYFERLDEVIGRE
ncbi:hypothetical protein GCM10008995_06150 [Halobellus salinus]|uniref:Uncharacterized protein n=1 Tax=Halobellus salinus TaxID=931585 RepID=A0A830EK68_9EURY|nr:DUF5820 family protein [Halobellus salinus]GGI99055.1 hypothetical protein GCM10008995_06150 [Halobellus salinus]SMP05273.1 hypothetical protein SAMN06265347_10260 [Halobellus salinus]